MKQEIGAIFLVGVIGAAAWWYQSQHRTRIMGTSQVPNIVTNDAGSIVPVAQVSNVDEQNNDWSGVPNYLKENYPSNRGGSGVVPSMSTWNLPDSFNPQEIPPQL